MALFLFIVLVAIVLGLIGVVVKGLIYLLVIGVVIFVLNLVVHGARLRHRSRRRPPPCPPPAGEGPARRCWSGGGTGPTACWRQTPASTACSPPPARWWG